MSPLFRVAPAPGDDVDDRRQDEGTGLRRAVNPYGQPCR